VLFQSCSIGLRDELVAGEDRQQRGVAARENRDALRGWFNSRVRAARRRWGQRAGDGGRLCTCGSGRAREHGAAAGAGLHDPKPKQARRPQRPPSRVLRQGAVVPMHPRMTTFFSCIFFVLHTVPSRLPFSSLDTFVCHCT